MRGCYVDYRVMLERADRDIDAVLIAAPNHIHAVAAMAAMRAGKGVYCEKPLTHSIYEARQLARAARETGVATQMGNQGHSTDDIRRAVEWIRDGAIGKVREVHAWRGGPNRAMPTERPAETPPVPEGLNWDLWLGPAKARPFHPVYAPLMFHYWWDFGSGTLGNFGCHTLDTAGVGARPGASGDGRGQFDDVERGDHARGGHVSLPVPEPGRPAAGRSVLVRRRPATAASRVPGTGSGSSRWTVDR